MHLDEEQLQRHLHGELTTSAASSVRNHLQGCAECRTLVANAEREQEELYELLRNVDHPPPRVDAKAVIAKAQPQPRGWGRWAAAILLTTGVAAVVYAAPGSPLRSWFRTITQRSAESSAIPRRPVGPDVGPEPGTSGVVVTPTRDFVIVFTSAQDVGHAVVSLTDDTNVTIRVPSGAANFTSDEKRLVIDNQGAAAVFEIDIPRAAQQIEIRVQGTRVFYKQGPRITTDGPRGSDGRYTLKLKQ